MVPLGDEAFLKLTSGPTVFENYGRSKVWIKVTVFEKFDLTNLKVEASFKQLEVERLGW